MKKVYLETICKSRSDSKRKKKDKTVVRDGLLVKYLGQQVQFLIVVT